MNVLEKQTQDFYHKQGWLSLHKGWPDFLFFRNTKTGVELLAVEVKSKTDNLRADQFDGPDDESPNWDVLDKLAQVLPVRVVRELPNGDVVEREFDKEWGELRRGRRINGNK